MSSSGSVRPAFASLALALLPGFVAGAALQLQQAALWPGWIYGLFMAAALAVWGLAAIEKVANRMRLPAAVLAGLLLGFSLTGLRAAGFAADALDPALQGRDLQVTGVVMAMPERVDGGTRFRLRVDRALLDGQPVRVPPRIDLGWYSGVIGRSDEAGQLAELQRRSADVRAGERWQLSVRLKAPHGAANPFGFDLELWLWEQGVQATGYVRATPRDAPPLRLEQTWWHPVEQLRQATRDAIDAQVDERRFAGLIAALVVGDQAAIDRADWDVFRATGVAHLMSISGLHITMFAWGAAALVGWLWRRSVRLCLFFPAPAAGLLGGMALALAYAIFSGWGVPSQRTVLMLATVGLLRLTGRQWPWPQVWMLACAVVVAADPWALLQAGFWLSFVAVGILFATDPGDAGQGEGGSAAREAASVGATSQWRTGSIHTYDDHRVAMCFSLAAFNPARLPVRIEDPKCVAKTFPDYFETLFSVSHADPKAIPVICVDGPTASGKGTLAAVLAQKLGYHFLDSGSLYRITGLAASRAGIGLELANEAAIVALLQRLPIRFEGSHIWLADEDVSEAIRTEEAGMNASRVSAFPGVRDALIALQRSFRRLPGLVADGRDMGTVIFPDAPLKVYLTASAACRAERRHKQLISKGISATLDSLRADLEARDARDASRSVAPLKPAEDARLLDNSERTVPDTVAQVLCWWPGPAHQA